VVAKLGMRRVGARGKSERSCYVRWDDGHTIWTQCPRLRPEISSDLSGTKLASPPSAAPTQPLQVPGLPPSHASRVERVEEYATSKPADGTPSSNGVPAAALGAGGSCGPARTDTAGRHASGDGLALSHKFAVGDAVVSKAYAGRQAEASASGRGIVTAVHARGTVCAHSTAYEVAWGDDRTSTAEASKLVRQQAGLAPPPALQHATARARDIDAGARVVSIAMAGRPLPDVPRSSRGVVARVELRRSSARGKAKSHCFVPLGRRAHDVDTAHWAASRAYTCERRASRCGLRAAACCGQCSRPPCCQQRRRRRPGQQQQRIRRRRHR
jgi:hypothetical protein